jgi:hypothetical protein
VAVATWETVCEIVGALPGAELDPPPASAPAWRVNGKVIARKEPRLRVPDEEAIRAARGELASVRVDRDERELLIRDDPEAFLVTPHWQTSPHVLVWLRAVDGNRLRELLVDAWRGCATRRLVRELEGL